MNRENVTQILLNNHSIINSYYYINPEAVPTELQPKVAKENKKVTAALFQYGYDTFIDLWASNGHHPSIHDLIQALPQNLREKTNDHLAAHVISGWNKARGEAWGV